MESGTADIFDSSSMLNALRRALAVAMSAKVDWEESLGVGFLCVGRTRLGAVVVEGRRFGLLGFGV